MLRKTILISFVLWGANAHPALTEPGVISLRDAVERALTNSNQIKAAAFMAEAAHQTTGSAASRYYPGLALEESFVTSNAPTQTFMMKLDQARFTQNDFQIARLNNPSATHDFRTSLTLRQPLFVPSVAAQKEIAVHSEEQERHLLAMTRQETAYRVFSLYLEIIRSHARLLAAEQAVNEAHENMRLATVRTAAGMGLHSDELRSRTHLSTMEQQLVTARNDLAIARLQFAYTIGLQSEATFDTTRSLPEITVPGALDDLITAALAKRGDFKAAQAVKNRADAGVKRARSDFLPTVDAFASYQLNARDIPLGSDNDSWSAGVNLKWQLFDGFRSCREYDRAVAERSSAAEMLDNGMKEIRLQLQEYLLRRDEAGKRLESARHRVRDAEETVRLLSRRFENSLATMVELLDAQTTLNQARATLADAESGYTLAGGRVYHAAGLLLEEILK